MTLSTAVVGTGYLGRFHAQKYAALPDCELIAVVDPDEAAAREHAEANGARALTDHRELLGKVDAVSIAAPTSLHYPIARDFLLHGAHVLVEKPITVTVAEAEELVGLARDQGLTLQVGHLERFNPALRAADGILDAPRFIESHRLAPFNPRGTDVDVVLDLMIHDIDIILDIVGSPVERADASGAAVLTGATDIANARLVFANGCVANVTASRVSAKTERRMRFFQHDCYLAVDFQQRQLSVHRKGEREMYPGIPELVSEEQSFEASDAIRDEIESFIECIRTGARPLVSGEDGCRALATAIDITQHFAEADHPR
jgi:predicted dehydrogenase